MAKDQLIIFDMTLRDGEQSPGASMTRDEKVRIAKALERLRVDVIEAGFAVASPGDFEAVKAVALSSYGIDSVQPRARLTVISKLQRRLSRQRHDVEFTHSSQPVQFI